MINLEEYEEVDTIDFKGIEGEYFNEFKVGDIIFHPGADRIELVITEDTDFIQEEVYPMVLNFGCLVFRKK